MEKKRNIAIDAIKGFAIIAVALFHFGGECLPYGYLGVDIFFVVGGYLLIGSLRRQIEQNEFNYWGFLLRKIIRLWPLVIIASVVAVIIGYFVMLPDDYENLVESTIASSVFSNNILQCITTKNYWDIVNLYKPLMHLWYVGILMQAYVVLPLVFILFTKIFKRKGMAIGTVGLTILSFVLFLLPFFSTAWKFYYLPFRVFEITCGGLLYFKEFKAKDSQKKIVALSSFCILIILLGSRVEFISGSVMLVLVVICTLAFIWSTNGVRLNGSLEYASLVCAAIGKRSYSIYIWHQMIVAFLFYSFMPNQNLITFFIFLGITIIISFLSYQLIEIPFRKIIGIKKKEVSIILSTMTIAIVLCLESFQIYRNAGVVRDVPELNIFKNDVHRGMHAEYCDRPYQWNDDFVDDNKVNVLVIGNSFGRDWANILHEWDSNHQLDISYLYYTGGYTDDDLIAYQNRINNADIIFFAIGGGVEYIPELLSNEKLYVISSKSYGKSNGIIYAHRFFDD